MSSAEGRERDILDTPHAGPAALRGSVLRGGGYVLGILLTLASAPLLIRHLGVDDFGRYVTVLSLVTLVTGLTEAGLTAIALREWATQHGEKRDRLMRNLVGIRLGLTTLAAAVGVGFAALAGYGGTLVAGTALVAAGFLLQAIANLLMVALQGELRFGWVTAVELARQVMTVVGIVVLVIAGAALLPFFAVTVAAGVIALGMTVWLVRGRMPLLPRWDPAEAWPLIRDSVPYAAAVAANIVYFRIAIIIMSLIATAKQTGYFATSFRVVEVLVAVPALAVGAAFPILSRAASDDRDRFRHAVRRIFEIGLIAGVWLALVVELSAPTIIDILAGSEGEPAVAVLRIQALALVATFVAVAAAYPLLSLRRHRALLVANAVALVASVALAFAFVPLWEARGAALAAVLAEVCLAVAQTVVLVRASPQTRPSFGAVPVVVLAAAAGAATLAVPGLHPVARAAIGTALYFGVIALGRRFPPELRHALARGDREERVNSASFRETGQS